MEPGGDGLARRLAGIGGGPQCFASAFDHPKKSKILNEKSIEIMFALPAGAAGKTKDGKPRDEYYGCGWEVELLDDGTRTTWHNGSLPGTSTLLAAATA